MKTFFNKEFGERVTQKRLEAFGPGSKPKHLAHYLNIPVRTVQSWEWGEATPNNPAKLIALANALKCDPRWLILGPKRKKKGYRLSPENQIILEDREKINEKK